MENAKKRFQLVLTSDKFQRLKDTSTRLSMTMTALLNRMIVDYLDSENVDETKTLLQAERITALEKQVVSLNRALKEMTTQAERIQARRQAQA